VQERSGGLRRFAHPQLGLAWFQQHTLVRPSGPITSWLCSCQRRRVYLTTDTGLKELVVSLMSAAWGPPQGGWLPPARSCLPELPTVGPQRRLGERHDGNGGMGSGAGLRLVALTWLAMSRLASRAKLEDAAKWRPRLFLDVREFSIERHRAALCQRRV
jgi:hypothetical protein